ncbi:hypothetical protein B0H19DRAFT_943255 [Mycena capillaripes]|nr:hypothetical protein B0H19DRAFT_943255 [Mycena capillaripes]
MTDTPLVYQDAPLLSPLSCFLDFGDSFSSVSPSSPLEDFGSLGSPYYKWSDVDNYVSPMLSYKHGYPLFHPAPCDDLPEAARRIGTQIGDVGVVTEDGSFDPIFNIRLAADDPANRFGVPADFEQVVLRDDIRRRRSHPPGTVLSNMTRRKRQPSFGTNGTEVKNSKPVGTLTLPDGALSWDLHSQQVFRDYALKHAQNWYAFVKDGLQRIIGDGDLYLITGVTKSTSWRIETLKHYSENVEVSLKPEAPHGIDGSQESESVSSSFNYGPHRLPGEESWKDNQTIFLRGFKVAVRPPSGGSYGESGALFVGLLSSLHSSLNCL